MSVKATVSPEFFLFSNAHCCTAPSIWRRLLMQAFACETVRARTKLGIAIAARRPMMATTIMISTRVKPDSFVVLIFITTFAVVAFFFGVNVTTGGLITISVVVHKLPVVPKHSLSSIRNTSFPSDGGRGFNEPPGQHLVQPACWGSQSTYLQFENLDLRPLFSQS